MHTGTKFISNLKNSQIYGNKIYKRLRFSKETVGHDKT